MGTKQDVITEIYQICKEKHDFIFDNDLVKQISRKYGFANPFDATKFDNTSKLPQLLIDRRGLFYFAFGRG